MWLKEPFSIEELVKT